MADLTTTERYRDHRVRRAWPAQGAHGRAPAVERLFGIRLSGTHAVDPTTASPVSTIFGALSWSDPDGGETRQDAATLAEELRHRPGATAQCTFRRATLGVRTRLTAEGALAEADGLALALDARFDERRRRAAQLRLPPDATDMAMATAAARRHGSRFLAFLPGDVAAAVWDDSRSTLMLSRDHIGSRPLYYASGADRVAFASEAAALLALEWVDGTLDESSLAAYLARGRLEGGQTFHLGVHKVPPATAVVLGPDGRRVVPYWTPPLDVTLRLDDDAAYEEAYRSELERAVTDRMQPQDTVAAHLSGGLDSSAVAVIAARAVQARGRRLVAVSFDEVRPHDLPQPVAASLVEAVRDQEPNLLLHKVEWGGGGWPEGERPVLRDLPNYLPCSDHEVDEHRVLPSFGVDVVLSGWGGDECATSNAAGWHFEQLAHMRLGLLWQDARARARAGGHMLPRPPVRGIAGSALSTAAARRLGLPAPGGPKHATRARRQLAWTDPEWAQVSGLADTVAEPRHAPSSVRALQAARLSGGGLSWRMELWDRFGAAAHLTYRYPLIDVGLLDLCLSLPPNQLVREGRGRSLHRRALVGVLPELLLRSPAKAMAVSPIVIRMARERDLLIRRLGEMRGDPAVGGRLNLEAMATTLRSIPSLDALNPLGGGALPASWDEVVGLPRFLALAEFIHAQSTGEWARTP